MEKTKDPNAQNLSLKRWAGKSKKYRKAVGLMLARARKARKDSKIAPK